MRSIGPAASEHPARPKARALALGVALTVVAAACTSYGDADPEVVPATADTLGMRVGGGFFDLEAFEAEEARLGTQFRYTVQFTGKESVEDMTGSAFGLLAGERAQLPEVSDRLRLSITVPLGFGDANAQSDEGRQAVAANLAETASGAHDDAYRRVANRLVEAGFGDAVIRLGHEFNGRWPPYSSRGNEDVYIEAYRQVHGVLAEVSPDFVFDWTSMRLQWQTSVPVAYPGDDVVDIVGLDVYWRSADVGRRAWDGATWRHDFRLILEAHRDFAIRHGKQVSYPEWGLAGADVPEFIEAMHDWFDGLPDEGAGSLVYQAYFNSNKQYRLREYPDSALRYRELFSDTPTASDEPGSG